MAFTAGEVTNIANAALDFYLNKGTTFKQSIQQKPLLDMMESKYKTFPGGKGSISLAVKGVYGAGGTNDGVAGYTHNDAVNFYTPANIQRVNFPWREHHIGLTLTHTELKIDGISVTDDEGNGTSTSEHSKREMTALVGLLQDKLEDFGQQYAIKMNALLWGDGVADPKALAGLRSIIVDAPTLGTFGGLTRTTNTWWRNRAATTANAAAGGQGPITSATTNGGALLQFLQAESRQLIRYGARPNVALAGSSFIAAMETETRANGNYSMTGFTGAQDGGMGMVGVGMIKPKYDPTLDDLGFAKRCYVFDDRHIYLMAMEDEWKHTFTPSRPPNQFVLYKSLTCTGQMVAQQLNGAAVYDIA
jgi:hypothetical protein